MITVTTDNHVSVIKSKLSLRSIGFVEQETYEQIYHDWHVPGVPHAHFFVKLLGLKNEHRCNHLLGLVEYGSTIMQATTLRDVLEILFDILEVMRYLYVERKVLHRDISHGSVLLMKNPKTPTSDLEDHKRICFIRHLLDLKVRPHETQGMPIDFKNAPCLDEQEEKDEGRKARTATPWFIARAVDNNAALPLDPYIVIPRIPAAPDAYQIKHPTRVSRFPPSIPRALPQKQSDNHWRHDLDHDAESVFWVLIYWLIAAQPVGKGPEIISPFVWGTFTGDWESRNTFITSKMSGASFHSTLRPAVALVQDVARVFAPDRSWLLEQDPRNHPKYALEAFQRLILSFILENQDKEFLHHPVDAHQAYKMI